MGVTILQAMTCNHCCFHRNIMFATSVWYFYQSHPSLRGNKYGKNLEKLFYALSHAITNVNLFVKHREVISVFFFTNNDNRTFSFNLSDIFYPKISP